MAIIECPECKREVSDKAVSCPMCGYPINVSTQESMIDKIKKNKIKLIIFIIIVVLTIAVVYFAKVFFHPDLKFEDLVFGDERVSSLLGYSTGIDDDDNKYWDNCVKLYGVEVDHLTYGDGWYYFYFSVEKRDDVRRIVYDYCDYSGVSELYYDEDERLAVWWKKKCDFGDYKGYYLIKVTKAK